MMILCQGRNVATGEIVRVEGEAALTNVDLWIDAVDDGTWVAPGFVDLQVNGFAGADYNSPDTSREAIGKSIDAIFSTGVTRFFPTVITGSPERITGALRNLARAKASLANGAAMEAFHVEGPHISPEDGPRGAHPAAWVRPPDVEEFKRWQDAAEGDVRLVTLAPEWPKAPAYVEHLTGQGIAIAVGHTRATAAQLRDAVRAGATLSTHLGNGAHPLLPKTANYIWEQLAEDKLAASFIVDGHHLPEAFLRAALRAKGVERSVLVTDAVAPAMCAPGKFELGEVPVELLADGRVVMPGTSRLAGSSLRLDRAIGNAVRLGAVSLADAVTMATRNPARVGRIGGRMRGLHPGDRADAVRFLFDDGAVRILETWLSGKRVYKAFH